MWLYCHHLVNTEVNDIYFRHPISGHRYATSPPIHVSFVASRNPPRRSKRREGFVISYDYTGVVLEQSEIIFKLARFGNHFVFDNQKHQHRMKKEQQTIYVSPQVKTVEIKAQAIICQSVSGINSMEIDSDGGNDFE